MRVKLNWVELLTIVSTIGVVVGLLLPTILSPIHNHGYEHRYPAPVSGQIPDLERVAGDYYQGNGLSPNG